LTSDVTALLKQGLLLQKQRQFQQAIQRYQAALKQDEQNPDTLQLLAICFLEVGLIREAAKHIMRALEMKETAGGFSILGRVFEAQARFEDAAVYFERALTLDPQRTLYAASLADTYLALGKLSQARSTTAKALQLEPQNGRLLCTMGVIHQNEGNYAEALSNFRAAISADRGYLNAYTYLGENMIRFGDPLGWDLIHHRISLSGGLFRNFSQPIWEGEDLQGKTLFVYCDGGFGDTFELIRYLSHIPQDGQVILECQPRLKPLLQTLPGLAQCIGRGEPLPPFDLHTCVLSLPTLLSRRGVDLTTITAPYFKGSAKRRQHWRKRLKNTPAPRVGLSWRGNEDNFTKRRRSVPFIELKALLSNSAFSFIALQQDGSDEIAVHNCHTQILTFGNELDGAGQAFCDTTAIIENLDLIICSDTAVAHLAGALGKPVWLCLDSAPDWRWGLEDRATPNYPNTTLFRQQAPAKWKSVIDELKRALAQR